MSDQEKIMLPEVMVFGLYEIMMQKNWSLRLRRKQLEMTFLCFDYSFFLHLA